MGPSHGLDLNAITAKMVDTLAHRGPDDHGVWEDSGVAFGHSRLKVIDLEGGKQPMTDPENRVWLTFNGEIYNFRDLRNQLLQLGHTFRTRSDTEVLLHAYLEWELDALKRLEGMFAFAIWDRRTNQIHLVRDRLGIKPLYWMYSDSGTNGHAIRRIFFASEIKALLTLPGFRPRLNPKVLSYYLSHYQSVMGQETLYQGIWAVEPATVITFDDGEALPPQVNHYWSFPIPSPEQQEDRGEGYYSAKVRDLLTRAVERQIISDVPLGAYLSGGLDSTILVGLMAELGVKPIKTFSIGFDESEGNEFAFSQLAARTFGTDHTEISIGAGDYFPAMEELIRFKDAPLSVPNEVPLYLMSKVLKKDITVVLSGEGADELFGGYGVILRTPMDYQNLNHITDDKERQAFLSKLTCLYGTVDFVDEISHFRAAYSWMTSHELDKLLQPAYRNSQGADSIREYWEQKFQPLRQLLPEDRILNLMETVHLTGLLGRLDTTTMAASVEGRVPFTDTELLEFVARIPLEYKLRWKSPEHQRLASKSCCMEIAENLDITKYILKRTFQDIVPLPIIARRKASFPVPLDHWFQGPYRAYSWRVISSGKMMPEIFKMRELRRWFDDATSPNYGLKVWMLMNVSIWLDAYFS
jgi:asparagine synthase (glutamine-hydrolysing)